MYESPHTTCRQAFDRMCHYYAEHMAYQDPTVAQHAEYAHLEAVYARLQRIVDDEAIARYEQAWQASRESTRGERP